MNELKATYEGRNTSPTGQKITFKVNPIQGDMFFNKHSKETNFVISIEKKKRTLNANAYMWVLCDKIGQKLRTTKEEVYKTIIQRVGVFEEVAVTENNVDEFIKHWQSNGIGWLCIVENSKLKGCKKVVCYCGSSCYDQKQMARLVDEVVEEAKNLEIETLTPQEIARLKDTWKG